MCKKETIRVKNTFFRSQYLPCTFFFGFLLFGVFCFLVFLGWGGGGCGGVVLVWFFVANQANGVASSN